MRLPWTKDHNLERRDSSYTDAIVAAIVATAGGGGNAVPTATGALESCAGLVGRCFAAASVSGLPEATTRAITPMVLNTIGRSLIRDGECLYFLEVDDGGVQLRPASTWSIEGGSQPSSWVYRIDLPGPSETTTVDRVVAASVLHFKYSVEPSRPWKGIGPIATASLAGRLSASTIKALGDESTSPTANLLPVQADGEDPTVARLKADIRAATGETLLVETQGSGGWGAEGSARTGDNWTPRRLGANPPAGLIAAAQLGRTEIMGACGVWAGLFDQASDGGQREGFRRFLHATLSPLGRIVSAEIQEKIDPRANLGFDAIFAGDLSGRARAFQSLVNGGMALDKAAALAGLMDASE